MEALHFDRFELRPAQRLLLEQGRPVELGARALDVLCLLVEHAGRLVSKDTLLDRVWAGVIVEEANLHVQVSTLRKLLGRTAIATVPGQGYQFVQPLDRRGPARDEAPPAAGPSSARPLPAWPALLGREAELRALQDLVAQAPLVTVTGAGGSGKTLLARHFVERWRSAASASQALPAPMDVTWVELQEVTEPARVPQAVATALGFGASAASQAGLCQALYGRRDLLVLDNAEHLLAAVAGLAEALGAAAPGLRLLVTSQAPLKLPAERVLRLGGLSVPTAPCTAAEAQTHAAVALFVAQARQVDRRFRLDDGSVEDVVAICGALEGQALGLQLAASLLAMQPLGEVKRRLVPASPALAAASGEPSQNVLRAALAWSHSLLDEAPRRVFRRLAVVMGAVPLPMLLRLVGDDAFDDTALADALADLVDRSLVMLEPPVTGGVPRYRLSESTRRLALEELQASGEAEAVRARLARALAEQADAVIEALLHDQDAKSRLEVYGGMLTASDVQSSLHWAVEHDLPAAASIARTVASHQLPASERLALAERLFAAAPGRPPRARADLLMSAASLTKHSDLGRRHATFMDAARAYAECGDRRSRYYALARAAESGAVHREPALADEPLAQARALEDPAWPPGLRQMLAVAEAATLSARDRLVEAVPAWRRALDLSRAARATSLTTLVSLADAELTIGQVDAAAGHLREAAQIAAGIGQQNDRWTFILANLTAACLMQGDMAGARTAAAEAWPHARRLDADAWWADHLALLAALEARPCTAALLLGLADAAYARIKDGRHQLETRHADDAAHRARRALGEARFDALRSAGATEAWAERLQRHALDTVDLAVP